MTVLATVTSVSFIALWGCATFLVPQHINSLFRYELWRLRDELRDHVYHKRLPESVMLLVSVTETFIRFSDFIRLSDFLASHLAPTPAEIPANLNESLLSGLSDPERALLTSYIDRLIHAVLSKMVLAGPFGWIPFLVQQAVGDQRFAQSVFWVISPAKRRAVDEERRKAELRKLRQLQDVVTWKAAKREQLHSLADYAA